MNYIDKPILLSIRLMTYNHASFIEDALAGIDIQKTNFPIEVVVGDDFSEDGTLEKIISYSFSNPNLSLNILQRDVGDSYYIERQKKGRIYNFLDILRNCQGQYIALLDGDDYWTDPLKLQKQVDFLERNEDYILSFHPCKFLKESKEPGKGTFRIQNINKIKYEYTVSNLLKKWGIPTASLVFRNTEDEFPPWFSQVASGDIALVMTFFSKGKFKLIEEHMSVYRKTGRGVSESHKTHRMVHYRAVLYSHLNEYFNFKYEKEIYEALDFIYHEYTRIPYSNNKKLNCTRRLRNYFIR